MGGFAAWRSLFPGDFGGSRELERGPKGSLISIEAGEPLGKLLEFSCEKNLTGLEWAAGIPGTVGGALFMNAGAFGGEMKDGLQSLRLMDGEGNVLEMRKRGVEFLLPLSGAEKGMGDSRRYI